ncbi:MAG: amidohydrolase [Chloroflexia bacterium]|nr:amidohydrolase [Chloroflexia bacterium]MDQ3412418.1 amidohydrolase [Chloroflexota bacterium]
MTTQTRTAPRPPVSPLRLGTIDVDLHHQIADWSAIAPFVPAGLRHRFTRKGGPPMARHGFTLVGPSPVPEPLAATDPARVRDSYLAPHGIDLAILTGTIFSLGVQPNPDLAAALARGVNDWTLETWVRPFACFKGSILVAPQDPTAAVAEIDRLGPDPGMVQVLLGSASEAPLGRRAFHPIYAACARHGLPLALHAGGEGAGMSPPATAVGHPASTFEWYGSLPQASMAHLMSMVTEGVFERFPTLKVVLYEAGIFWLPHLMWRFDKNWKAQRAETPWLTEPPSAYLRRHLHLTSYPLELPPAASIMADMLELVGAERTLLFGSAYPDWEFGDPFAMLADMPDDLRTRVLADNARSVYSERLGAAH